MKRKRLNQIQTEMLENYIAKVMPDRLKLYPDTDADIESKAAEFYLQFPVPKTGFMYRCRKAGIQFVYKKPGPKPGSSWKQKKKRPAGSIAALEKRIDELEAKLNERHQWHKTCFKQIYNALKREKNKRPSFPGRSQFSLLN